MVIICRPINVFVSLLLTSYSQQVDTKLHFVLLKVFTHEGEDECIFLKIIHTPKSQSTLEDIIMRPSFILLEKMSALHEKLSLYAYLPHPKGVSISYW